MMYDFLFDYEKIDSFLDEKQKFKNKTFFVTGATGFFGKYFINYLLYLNNKYELKIKLILNSRDKIEIEKVYGKESKYIKYIIQDVRKQFIVDEKIDFIIHAASNTHPVQYANDPIGTIDVNYNGTKNIFDLAIEKNVEQTILLSTVEIYGQPDEKTKYMDEKYLGYINSNTLRSGYPESKRLVESLANAYSEKHGLNFIILRLARAYGPTLLLNDSKALSQFIIRAALNKNIIIKSDGKQLFSYVYVGDITSAIMFLLLKGKNKEAYNVSIPNFDYNLRKIADILSNITGVKVIYEIPNDLEKKGYSNSVKSLLDTKKIENIGWKSIFNFEESLEFSVFYIRNTYN